MEAFGRIIAVAIAGVGAFLMVIFSKKAVLYRQKEIAMRSLTREYVGSLMEDRFFSVQQMDELKNKLSRLGDFEMEYTIMERIRFDSENGYNEAYRLCEEESVQLSGGSLVRVYVTERRSKTESFLYGPGAFCLFGGYVL